MRTGRILSLKLAIARKVVRQLKGEIGHNLLAVGTTGSVARGGPEQYSDVDLLVIVRRRLTNVSQFRIVDETYCSLVFETKDSGLSQLRRPNHELAELLGGFTRILPLYDPERLLPKLESRARSIPGELYRKSAQLALIHSYEDFCRVKNAYLKGDEIILKDNIYEVTHSAANVVACLNHTPFSSDREIFKAYKAFPKLPRRFGRIEQLRYGNMRGRRLFATLLRFYLDLVEFCQGEGVRFPVDRKVLSKLGP